MSSSSSATAERAAIDKLSMRSRFRGNALAAGVQLAARGERRNSLARNASSKRADAAHEPLR